MLEGAPPPTSGSLRTSRLFLSFLLVGALLGLVVQAQADTYNILFTQTSPTMDSGIATITTGSLASPGFLDITSFSAVTLSGFCLTCTNGLTEVLTGVLFDISDLDLSGHITGSYIWKNGGTHTC